MPTVYLSPIGNGFNFLNGAGSAPLSGGSITTYLAGTTTPQATYTTSAGSVANANPIVLNAAGSPVDSGNPVEIWLVSGISYKFLLKDSSGSQVAIYDNLSGINDGILGLSSSNVNFISAGTGAVTRTAQDKMRDVLSIKDFGAKGDGSTDDTSSIQSMFNNVSMGTTVYWPAGVYIITGTITIPAALLQAGQVDKGLEMLGAGTEVTVVRCNSDVTMFTATCGPTPGGSNLAWRGFTFLRSGATATHWIHSYTGVALVRFERCYFWSDDTNTAHETGIFLQWNGATAPSWEHLIYDCRFSGCSISMSAAADTWIDNCQIYPIVADGTSGGRNYGIKLNGCGDIKIRSHIGAAPNGAIWFTGSTANCAVVNSFFDTCANSSFLHAIFGSPAYTTFVGNIFGAMKGSAARVTDMILCTWMGNVYVNVGNLDGGSHHVINMLGSGTGSQQNSFIGEQFNGTTALTTKIYAISENTSAPNAGNNRIVSCNFNGAGTMFNTYPIAYGATPNNTVLWGNLQVNNVTSGTGSIGSGATSVNVTHGLGQTPDASAIKITGTSTMGASKFWWITAIGSTTFTVNVDAAPGGSGWSFSWQAAYRQT
jgi:hypothetical protein